MKSKLLNKKELEWSPVVANNSMNRERKAIGINSYQQDININPINFILSRSDQKDIRWLDLCCGRGNALIQAEKILNVKGLIQKIDLEGIDLVDFFSAASQNSNLTLKVQNLEAVSYTHLTLPTNREV